MAILRPGGFDITDRAMEIAELKKADKVLDIGCGEGDTVHHLKTDMGMDAEGIDMNLARIGTAKERYPGISVKFGDGEFLEDYMSFTFDGVFMECVLNAIKIPDESLHEVYCVLKKGGKLIISDFYEKNPDTKQMKAIRIEADRQSKIPHKRSDCNEHKERFTDFRFEGVFFKDPLIAQLEDIGYRVKTFEDRSKDLDAFMADADTKIRDIVLSDVKGKSGGKKRDIGYFLLVAEKPEN